MDNCDGEFSAEDEGKAHDDGNIRDWLMETNTKEGTYMFHSFDPGRQGQCYFLHKKVK